MGREGTASALVATATATAPCVSVTRSTLWPLASRAQKHLHLDCDRRSKSKPPPAGAQIGDRAGGSRVAPSAAALSRLARARTRITAREDRQLKSGPELQIRIMQLKREKSPPPGLRLPQTKLSHYSNRIARRRIRRFESYMPSHAVHLQCVTYGSRSESINLQMRAEAASLIQFLL